MTNRYEALPPEGSRPFDLDHAIQRIDDEAAKVRPADQDYLRSRTAVWLLFEAGIERKVDTGEITRQRANEIRATDRALREINQRRDQRFGLLTVSAVTERLYNDLLHADRLDEPLTLGVLDIDKFRDVNNLYGHSVGDKVLEETVKHYDLEDSVFGRWGGDEFLLYFRGQSVVEVFPQVSALNANYPAQLESIRKRHTIVDPITMSIGLTQHIPGQRVEQLIERADKVLYVAKAQGRNRVVHD
ncbi:MAG: GGDEF domain-containing protein [Candidatus Levybacteria bacterium]|nr:GGDEF domain-containing protein [Candidatus Levybacteria bacterium]